MRDWHAADPDNPVELIALDRPSTLRTLKTVANAYDVTILDGAAKLEDMMAAAIRVAD